MGLYSLNKSTKTLRHVYRIYRRKKKKIPSAQQEEIRSLLDFLQNAILSKNREKADTYAKKAEVFASMHFKKTSFEQLRDLIFALAFALVVAVLVRQIWFEFYEIPTGSMRPTLKEQDRLVVSKTDFGINYPLTPDHFYFDPQLVQRNGIVTFTGEDMDIPDVNTRYFYIFPGKKQFVKRLIGKPGDILYFYGGKIYGIDSEGNDISSLLQLPGLERIDHIPFIHFEGKVHVPNSPSGGIYSPVILYQMNEPIATLYLMHNSQLAGEMLQLSATHSPSAPPVVNYSDLWGFKNFATARLLTRAQVRQLTDQNPSQMEEGILYLELRHHPSLFSLKLQMDAWGRLRPMFNLSSSIIPLKEEHLRTLMDNLYTARFVVKNGFASRYGAMSSTSSRFLPHLPEVPDGCYEFYYGKACKVKWQGITEELPKEHPLYRFDPEQVQLLFNLGIEFDTRFSPESKNQALFPNRYAYFRDGDLYLMGAPVLKKGEDSLESFLAREHKRATASHPKTPYYAFEDQGPPLKSDGQIDTEFLKEFGLRVPQKSYLALGDNYAMSADSREFGFVPQNNLRGGPDFIFWPPGSRWGTPNQPSYPWINGPRGVVWLIAAGIAGGWFLLHRKRNRLPLHLN